MTGTKMSDTDTPDWRARKVETARGGIERRAFKATGLTLRANGTDKRRLEGWAAVFDDVYECGGFDERVVRGAFERCLSERPDVVLNIAHGAAGSGLPIARTRADTLELAEDQRGLHVSATLDPADPDVQLLESKFRTGALDGQMSMAFRVNRDSFDSERNLRSLLEINLAKGDVSIVPFAASPTTSSTFRDVALRALPDHTTSAAERLAVMRLAGPRRPTRAVPAVPSTDYYRRRLALLRRGA
jgi:HK97 family phage prohead protease